MTEEPETKAWPFTTPPRIPENTQPTRSGHLMATLKHSGGYNNVNVEPTYGTEYQAAGAAVLKYKEVLHDVLFPVGKEVLVRYGTRLG